MKLYAHSTLLYWWPVWLTSFGLGVWSMIAGDDVPLGDGTIRMLPSSSPGFLFIILMVLVAVVTTNKLKGLRSVILMLSVLLLAILAAWAGLIDEIIGSIAAVSTHVSAGFYLTFGTGLVALWASTVFVFDKLSYWRISEGQLVRVRVIGAAEKAYDARGLTVEHEADDLLRHLVFGFRSGDIVLRTSGAENATVALRNVLFVDRKISEIQRLVSVEPDDIRE
ncbi:MAG: hypothetical protein AAFX03_04060 [Pseudomonadota bacterium]